MTIIAADRSTRHTIVTACVVLALLALPFMGVLHCQIMHDDQGHTSTPLAEACCVLLCFTALVGVTILPLRWLTVARAALHLKPVRLTSHLIRWVPPPRPVALLP